MAIRKHGRAWIGCSGWEYKHWRGNFYPADLPRRAWLEHYGGLFDTVEINNSFYRLPPEASIDAWRNRAPAGFLFAMKASRFLTHMKKLKDPEDPLRLFFSRARRLRSKLGPILYQLPPRWKPNSERLESFLRALPARVRHAIEFREPSWYDDEIYRLLAKRSVALCLHDMPGSATPRRAVGRFVYVRFHGAEAKYAGGYPDAHLASWGDWLRDQLRTGRDAYVYFNNDVGGHAPRDAQRLKRHLARR